MKLHLDGNNIGSYHSNSQIARIVTERWVKENMYCPHCGNIHINQFENNRPVADFFCPHCNQQYELKSKNGALGNKITDGAYETMIKRITGNQNPDFFFLSYSKTEGIVQNLILIPKHFFVPDMIEKRKPLAQTARRAGWVGCNIVIEKVPEQGRISIIADGKIADIKTVIQKVNASSKLEVKDVSHRGWIMDVLNCINQLHSTDFSLKDLYFFEHELQRKHPENHNIRPKIRQQLQLLRDRGYIAFLGNGNYKKIW